MSMNSSDFNKILKTYDAKQARNKREQLERKKEVFAKIPELKDIQKRISEVGLDCITKTLNNPSKKDFYDTYLKETLYELKQQKEKLLTAGHYSSDYLDEQFDCSDCKDTGYIGNNECHCLKQAIINYAYEQSNLKHILTKENFDTFSFDYYSKENDPKTGLSPYKNMLSVHHLCVEFVESFDHENKNLILYGESGLGKTFLCNSIAKELLDQSKTVIYLSAFQLFRLFENYRFHNKEEIVSNADIENIFECDLLIIDDLGTEFSNALTSAELFNCLNTRLLNQKSTVISTNLAPKEWVNAYSERIISRIFGYYTQLKFFGSDIRLKRYS